MVGTSSPVSSFRSTMVTRSTLMISKVTSTTARSSRSRSSSAESFWETSSSIWSLRAWRASPRRRLHLELAHGWTVPAGDARRHAAAHHELPDDLPAGGTHLNGEGWPLMHVGGRAGCRQAEDHLAEGDGVLEPEPARRDPGAVDEGAVRAAEVLHLHAVGADDELGVTAGDGRVVDGDVARERRGRRPGSGRPSARRSGRRRC